MKQNDQLRLTADEFDAVVKRAIARIPRAIRAHLDNIEIDVRKRPTKKLLRELGMEPDELLCGYYQGTALTERTDTDPPLYPDSIILFQEDIEDGCSTRREIEREIELTVVHEIAHHIGFDEDELDALGYG